MILPTVYGKKVRDGAASQFKQRYLFSNLHHWEQNTQTKMIWNFFATSHGKGAVDGIGGTVKRSVWRFVRAGADAPLDAKSYAKIAEQRNPNINISFITADEIQAKSIEMTEQWKSVIPVPNTLKLHCIRPHGSKKLSVSTVSFGEIFNVIGIFEMQNEELLEGEISDDENHACVMQFSVGDWILASYDNTNFAGEILQIVNEEFEVSVRHRSGNFWKWPQREDNIFYNRKNIIKQLDPPQVAGSRGQFEFKEL